MTTSARRQRLLDKLYQLPTDLLDSRLYERPKAALIMGRSVRTLESYRQKKLDPIPQGGFENCKSGRTVEYSARVLLDWLKGIRTVSPNGDAKPEPASAEPRTPSTFGTGLGARSGKSGDAAGFLSDDAMAHRKDWVSCVQAESEEAEFAFFVDERGLVLTHAWQSVDQTFEMLMSPKTDVVWQTWIAALADVWADEGERQRVMQECADIDASVPEKVQALRNAKLASI
jgi:hypothetical protein